MSSVPARIEVRASLMGFQNRLPPQRAQKPRFASALDGYQASVSLLIISSASSGVDVAATKLPLVFWHWLQWQAVMARSGPLTR